MDDSESFPIGKVIGFHGLRGTIKVLPSTNNPSLLLDVESAEVVFPDGRKMETEVTDMKLQGKLLLINLKGFDDRTTAETLTGTELQTKRSELRDLEEEEFWVSDLVGMAVVTTSGAQVGTVQSVVDSANQLLEVAPPGGGSKTILIPFVKDLVPEVSARTRTITVADIPGLLEPQ